MLLFKGFHLFLISFSSRLLHLVKLFLAQNSLWLVRLGKRLCLLVLITLRIWNFIPLFNFLSVFLGDSDKLILKLLIFITILLVHNACKPSDFRLDMSLKLHLLLLKLLLLGQVLDLGSEVNMNLCLDLRFFLFWNFLLLHVSWVLI